MAEKMKNWLSNFKENLNELSSAKKTLIALLTLTIIFAIIVFLFSVSFKNYLYGYNVDWFFYIFRYTITFKEFLTINTPIGVIFDKVLSLIFGPHPVAFYIFIILGIYCIIVSTFFLLYSIGKNRFQCFFASLLMMGSLPLFSCFFEVRSCQFLFAPLFLIWGMFFFVRYKASQKNIYYCLTIVFALLFVFEFPLPIILLPILLVLLIKNEKSIRYIVPEVSIIVLSVITSIKCFLYYSDEPIKYYAHTLDGILNFINIPQSYLYNYYFKFDGISILSKLFIVISSIAIIVFFLSAIFILAIKAITEKTKLAITFFVSSIIQSLLIFGLIGFLRYFSVSSFIPLNVLFIVLASCIYDTNLELKKLKLSVISSIASIIGMLLCITPYYTSYARPNINYMEARIKLVNNYGKNKNVAAICFDSDFFLWKTMSNYINKNYEFDIINLNENNYYSPEKYNSAVAIYDFDKTRIINRGLTIDNEWISGTYYDNLVFTTTTDVVIKYSLPEEFPTNTISFYCNDRLLRKEVDWKGESELRFKANEKSGSFLYLRIECERSFRPADYIENNEDYRYFSLFINEFILE